VVESDQPLDQRRAAARHPHVGQDECRAVLASGRHGIVAVGHLRDDVEVRLLLQQPDQGARDPVVVVRDDDGDLVPPSGLHGSTVPHGATVCLDAGALIPLVPLHYAARSPVGRHVSDSDP
jgi:hypothetical protein